MSSQGEKIGSALAKAIRGTAAKMKDDAPATVMYRTNLRDVPKVEGLKRDDGWVDMQVQFLIDKKSAGADHVVGWTVLKPGARHENHRHHNCDEFFIVLKGKGHIYTDPATSRRAKATWFIRRAAAGTASTTRRMKTWCWCGAGWARARSRIPAIKSIPIATNDGVTDEALGRPARRARHGDATRQAARAPCRR